MSRDFASFDNLSQADLEAMLDRLSLVGYDRDAAGDNRDYVRAAGPALQKALRRGLLTSHGYGHAAALASGLGAPGVLTMATIDLPATETSGEWTVSWGANIRTTTGYVALQVILPDGEQETRLYGNGNPATIIDASGGWTLKIGIRPQLKILRAWSCTSAGNATPSGQINFYSDEGSTLVNAPEAGATGVHAIDLGGLPLTAFHISGWTSIDSFEALPATYRTLDLGGARATLGELNIGQSGVEALDLSHCPELYRLAGIELPNLRFIDLAGSPFSAGAAARLFQVSTCPALQTLWGLPTSPTWEMGLVITGAALDARTVDAIFFAMADEPATVSTNNGVINLSGGTSAAPTALSAARRAALASGGWTITTN